MDRREMLKWTLGAVGAAMLGCDQFSQMPKMSFSLGSEAPLYCGWLNDPEAQARFIETTAQPFLSEQNSKIKGTGEGKTVLLHKFFEYVTGAPLIPHHQTCGDCVSQAFGLGVDILTAVRMAWRNKQEVWLAKCATEIIYAGSRVEVGGGRLRGDGSMGVWAASFVRDWGTLLRQPYLDGEFDYTNYDGDLARKLGKSGVPDVLERLCRLHPLRTCSIVRSWEECRDAVVNGYSVAMCSDVGFKDEMDEEGFLEESRKPWYHAMLIHGAKDDRRPGGLVQNSWGSRWITNPVPISRQPAGSFWADADVIDKAMRQGDSIALSGYVGYPRCNVPDYTLW